MMHLENAKSILEEGDERSFVRDTLQGLIDEIARLRAENERLKASEQRLYDALFPLIGELPPASLAPGHCRVCGDAGKTVLVNKAVQAMHGASTCTFKDSIPDVVRERDSAIDRATQAEAQVAHANDMLLESARARREAEAQAAACVGMINSLVRELRWCAGSEDFNDDGIAREGWKRGPEQSIAAARELLSTLPARAKAMAKMPGILANFEFSGPDGDGFFWLVLHGKETTGKGAINLGKDSKPHMIVYQVLRYLEDDRKETLAAYHAEPVAQSGQETGMEKRT